MHKASNNHCNNKASFSSTKYILYHDDIVFDILQNLHRLDVISDNIGQLWDEL